MALLVLRWILLSAATICPAMLIFFYADGEVASGPIWGEVLVSAVFCFVVSTIIIVPIALWPLIVRVAPYVESSRIRFALAWFIWIAVLDSVFLISTNHTIPVLAIIPLAAFFILTLGPRILDSRLAVGVFLPNYHQNSSTASDGRFGV